MEADNQVAQAAPRLSKRNMYTFPVGTIGRDMACSGLFTGQLLNYIYFTKSLTAAQLTVLTLLMTLAKVFDALNDPFMGNIIDATHTRWGKFKPWIFAGMIGTAGVIIGSFSNNFQGWSYVAFFGVTYFLYSIVFTMNDIGYWGMVPALAKHPDDRNKLSALTAFCANIGGGLCGVLVPILTTGSMAVNGSAIKAYSYVSIIFVAVFIIFQCVMLFGVKETGTLLPAQREKVGIKQVVGVFKKNDQLRWVALIFLCTQLLPGTAITMYIYFQFGYEGTLLTLFYVFSAVATVIINVFYPSLSKKLSRKGMLKLATVFQVLGNALILIFAFAVPKGIGSFVIPIFNVRVTLQFILIAFSYFFCGFASTAYYMVLMICIANTVEYNDLRYGKRDEGIIFSTRAFLVKFGGAIVTLYVMLFYVIIGANKETDAISALERAANMGEITAAEKLSGISAIIEGIPSGKTIAILLLVTLLPIALYLLAYWIYRKKFVIDEAYFDKMTEEIRLRNEAAEEKEANEQTVFVGESDEKTVAAAEVNGVIDSVEEHVTDNALNNATDNADSPSSDVTNSATDNADK